MTGKKYIICLGTQPWSDSLDRTQHLMANFKDFNILYFYPPTQGQSLKVKVSPKVWAYALPKEYPTHPEWVGAILRWRKLGKYIEGVLKKHRVRTPILWLTNPIQEELIHFLDIRPVVYDCQKIYRGALGISQEMLVSQSKVVFVSNIQMKKELICWNKNVVVLENGVDFSLFEETFMRANLICENSFGFYGTIHANLDLSPLLYTAEKQPQWSFHLIGRCDRRNQYVDYLRHLPNVRFLGVKEEFKVVEFLLSRKVLMEFRSFEDGYSQFERYILEYLATGKPVVSHLWPNEDVDYDDVLYTCSDEHDFYRKCRNALREQKKELRQCRKEYGKTNSWQIRAEFIEFLFESMGY